jgi:signal transduction histidine kinase
MKALARLTRRLPRPLDPIRSIKMKLGLVVVVSGFAGLVYFWINIGWITPGTSIVAISLSLLTTQFLANGTTRPLREMTAAAKAMARGDYSQRVRATSRDEVGELAQAFNLMAADLATADQHRRELIANVSHELRTPITALRAVLENIVDGVAESDPQTLRTALAQTERLGRLVTELRTCPGSTPARTGCSSSSLWGPSWTRSSRRPVVTASRSRGHLRLRRTRPRGPPRRSRTAQAGPAEPAGQRCRHSPVGGQVTIRANTRDCSLVLEVLDDGPASLRVSGLVFEHFTRGERATGGGTGLGLAIARWVVNRTAALSRSPRRRTSPRPPRPPAPAPAPAPAA